MTDLTLSLNTMVHYDFLVKLLALGDSGVGKTSFLHRYADGSFKSNCMPTVGIDFKEKIINKKRIIVNNSTTTATARNHRIKLQLWDTAGIHCATFKRYYSLTRSFYRQCMGFLLIFDLTNEQSFIHVRHWLSQLKVHAFHENPVIVLCGNKCDLERRAITEEQASRFAEDESLFYFETSALTGTNVEEAVDQLLDSIMQQMDEKIDKLFNSNGEKHVKPVNCSNWASCSNVC